MSDTKKKDGDVDDKKNRVATRTPNPGKCPKCQVRYIQFEKSYYCSICGDMGWFTWDDYFDE